MKSGIAVVALILASGSINSLVIADDKAPKPATTPTMPAATVPAGTPVVTPAFNPAAMIPSDPTLITGQLDNGLKYIIRPNKNPEARASVWMRIDSGSLNETEKTRGIAHFLEHMAFNGSENFPPGSVINFFQGLGLQFGRDQNAYTSFDETVYQLALPDNKTETLDKALTFMSDVNGRLLLRIDEIDSERGIIQEERRTRLSAGQRIQEYIFERLAPESTFGRRLPIGTVETINSVSREDFLGYWSTYYVPSNSTVIVVGDVDPAVTADRIKHHFGSLKKVAKPADLPVGIKPSEGLRAIVATDAELKTGSISLTRYSPPRGPSLTMADARRDFVDLIGTWAFNRRIASDLEKGQGRFLQASASIGDFFGSALSSDLRIGGKPELWREMLTDLGVAVQRARIHGFTDQEIDDARQALISGAEESVKAEATRPASVFLRRINGGVNDGEPITSAAQNLEILRTILPTITAKEVGQAFTANFDPTAGVFVAQLPSSASVPTEAELVDLGRKAFDVKPAKQDGVARVESLLKQAPTPGKMIETTTHSATEVTSAWLDNGARVHMRQNDQRKNEISISITLATGEILETAQNRGITSAATLAFSSSQATSTLSPTQIREFMTGKKASISGGPSGDDSVTLGISGSPEGIETALQLAHLLLTDPKVDATALTRWKDRQTQGIQMRKSQPGGLLGEVLSEAIYPKNEMRTRPLEQANIDAITLDAAQAWLTTKIINAPMEITIVGDFDQASTAALVQKYLGSLPSRPRISSTLFADLRKIERPKGPIGVTRTLKTQTPQAVVVDGFFGANYTDVADVRTLQMASRILSTRMVKTVREERQLVYSISAASRPSQAFPGYGVFTAQAPTDPSKAEALPATLDEMYSEFAKSGPTKEELEVAQRQLDKLLEEEMKKPDFWAARLSSIEYRGNKLDDIMTIRSFYAALTPENVRDVFAKYCKPENRFRVTVLPETTPKG
jgi:zinc protease